MVSDLALVGSVSIEGSATRLRGLLKEEVRSVQKANATRKTTRMSRERPSLGVVDILNFEVLPRIIFALYFPLFLAKLFEGITEKRTHVRFLPLICSVQSMAHQCTVRSTSGTWGAAQLAAMVSNECVKGVMILVQ